jgi:hypothetical protein
MAEESRRETPVERDVSTVPAAKLKAVRACDAGSPVRGRPFESGNAAAKNRRRAVSPIAQLDRQAKQVVRGLLRGMTNGALQPQRANAVIYALKFRSELFGSATTISTARTQHLVGSAPES